MALSYNLGYQESISVHPTRRQIFAGKPYSNFPNILEWLISGMHKRHRKLATSNQGDHNLGIPQELGFWFQRFVLTQSWNILVLQYHLQCYRNFTEMLCYCYQTKLSCNAGLNIEMHWNQREALSAVEDLIYFVLLIIPQDYTSLFYSWPPSDFLESEILTYS